MSEDGAAGFPGQADTGAVHAAPVVIDLVARARHGDKRSWDALVERYAPLIWSICRRYSLSRADAEDVGRQARPSLPCWPGPAGRAIREPTASV